MTLAVIIASYNTSDDLQQCLRSIYSSTQGVDFEVWVVDNNSPDNSAEMVAEQFPPVHLICNRENLGFSKANNAAIRQAAAAEFVLLLNPDTIVQDGAFSETIAFLRRNPSAGVVSCKLVKQDETMDLACRRSFPSVFDGFFRATGLAALFPKSRIFARYNLTFLPENETAEVDAVNGAFMMVRRAAIEETGLLDEDYFMYMEDLDWCYRFRKNGWKIYYDPTTTVIHLKGRAGKKSSSRMIGAFFESMELFCKKNYRERSSGLKFALTLAGIRAWKSLTLFRNMMRADKRVTP